MTRFRHLVRRSPTATLAMLVLALAMRLIVPAGYMPAGAHGWTMTICTGHGAVTTSAPAKSDATKSDQPCGFASLAVAGSGGEPPTVPAMASAWEASPLAAVAAPRAAYPARLRPPLRGPPPAFA